jgi:hypothetical protein
MKKTSQKTSFFNMGGVLCCVQHEVLSQMPMGQASWSRVSLLEKVDAIERWC